MLFVKVTHPQYDQSRPYQGRIGEVVGRWGPENSAEPREGYLVQFSDGEIVGLTEDEVVLAEGPAH
jgi:hypothetical protein